MKSYQTSSKKLYDQYRDELKKKIHHWLNELCEIKNVNLIIDKEQPFYYQLKTTKWKKSSFIDYN